MPDNLPNIWRENGDSSTSYVRICTGLAKICPGFVKTIEYWYKKNNQIRVYAKTHYSEHRR